MLPPLDITTPRELKKDNLVKLRIKSSKAFPTNESSALEELITRVKKIKEANELRAIRKKIN